MGAHLHILGICGTFMGGIAAIAKAAGYRVTGCDANVYPPMSDQLRALGIELTEGFEADQLAIRPDVWVIGNVVTRGNPLMEAILDQGARYVSGPQWLAEEVLIGKHVLAVAGTPWLAAVGVGLWGLHMGMTQGLLGALVADAAPEPLRGTAFGVFHLVSGVAMLFASVLAGVLWEALGPPATFLAGAAFTALGLVAMLAAVRPALQAPRPRA